MYASGGAGWPMLSPQSASGAGQVSTGKWLWSTSDKAGFAPGRKPEPSAAAQDARSRPESLGERDGRFAVFGASGRLGHVHEEHLRPVCRVPPGFRSHDKRLKGGASHPGKSLKRSRSCFAAPSDRPGEGADSDFGGGDDAGGGPSGPRADANPAPRRRASWVAGGAERAKSWVQSMSSFDAEFRGESRFRGDGALVSFGAGAGGGGVSFDPSTRIVRDTRIVWASGGAIRAPVGGGRGRQVRASDMAKFVARVKW